MSITIPEALRAGRTICGKAVSRLCFGTLTLSPLQLRLSPDKGADLLLYAAEKGVNFVDTASLYQTYDPIRLALRDCDLVVATKAYAYDNATAEQAFREAVEGIGREYIDVFLLHEQESEHTLRGHEEALSYFIRKKEEGAIGAVGLSTHHVAAVRAAVKHGGLDIVHPMINKAGLGIIPESEETLQGARTRMEEAIREASQAGLFIYGMKSLGGGHLVKDRQEALSYARDLPGMDAVAVGMQSIEEIDYNAAFFSGQEPSASLAQKSDRRLMIHDWCEKCGRCVKRCPQDALSLSNGEKASVDHQKCVLCGYCAAVCPQFCLKVI